MCLPSQQVGLNVPVVPRVEAICSLPSPESTTGFFVSNVSHEDGSSAKEAVETSAKAAAAKSAKATQVCKKE